MDFGKRSAIERRNAELRAAVRASRSVLLDGLQLEIDEDVFPPDLGLTTMLLASYLESCAVQSAIDVGTGTLFLALVMRRAGVSEVWATDNHPPAIRNARRNLANNLHLAPIVIAECDLMAGIPEGKTFELIVFNHPYYPIEDGDIAGMGPDGGREIISRFLHEAARHLAPGGHIVMPYSTLAGQEHDPRKQAGVSWVCEVVARCGAEHCLVCLSSPSRGGATQQF